MNVAEILNFQISKNAVEKYTRKTYQDLTLIAN